MLFKPATNPTMTRDDVFAQLKLDAKSSQPYYQQLQQQLLALIGSGALGPGRSLPAERVLAEQLQVSRNTIKRCYDALREAQTLGSAGRGGTMVRETPRVSPVMGRIKGFTEEMHELGMTPSTRVLERRVLQDRTIASVFGRPAAASFLKLVRLRLADEQPMSREVAWYDMSLAPALVDWDGHGSIYLFLADRCGVQLSQAEQTIEAVLSSTVEAEVFGFQTPAPCLLIKRHSYNSHRQLVEYVEGTFRGDAYAYKVKLQP